MKSILVTGANGFIGRHTLMPLIKKNLKVHAVFSQNKPAIEHPHIFWHQLNLHNQNQVKNLLKEVVPDYLLHLAWDITPVEYWTSINNILWLNSSIHLLTSFIKTGGQRAVFIGSCAEYDWQYGYCHEFLTPCNPQTLYGAAKYSLNVLCEIISREQNFSFAWARLFFLFGAYEHQQRLISSIICSLLKQQKFEVFKGYQLRDFMYVADVADALASLVITDVTGPINIASGNHLSIRNLTWLIGNKLSRTHLIDYRENKISSKDILLIADVSRLKEEVKWEPQYTLEKALDETIAWWRRRL